MNVGLIFVILHLLRVDALFW